MCFETTCDEMHMLDERTAAHSDAGHPRLQQQHSECPTFNKYRSAAFQIRYQVLSVVAPFSGVLFEKCEMSLVLFSLFRDSSLADRIQFTLTSSLWVISSSFWWHTGENIDTYGGTNQQQQNCRLAIVVFLFVLYVQVN